MTNQPANFAPDYAFPPGDTLRDKLSELGMTQVDLAQRLDLSEKHVSHMMRGNAPLTYETAMALERITGLPASTWNALEAHYRDHQLRQRQKTISDEERAWLAALPIAYLCRREYLSAASLNGSTLDEVLRFFAVADIKAWTRVWRQPIASFRRSTRHEINPEATATWLRLGEIQTANLVCAPFDASALRKLLPTFRSMTTSTDFVDRLTRLCASVGIALALVREVPGSRASGAARWLNPKRALIQLSDRYKKVDSFWFSFFHEIAHLLLHSKKETYIHDDGQGGFIEDEANQFARDALIPSKWQHRLAAIRTIPELLEFADDVGVSPSIVAGRLVRDKINGWTWPKVSRLRGSLRIIED